MAAMETRGSVRIKLDADATLSVDSAMKEQIRLLKEEQKAVISDISVSGMGVVSPVFFPRGATLRIQMDGAILNINKAIDIKGEVRYCKPDREKKYRLGIRFVEIEGEVLNKIKEYVSNYERREKPRVEFK